MAQREIVMFLDDIDGTELPFGHKAERFTVDGVAYEIDLTDDNAVELRQKLEMLAQAQAELVGRYLAVARKVEAPAPKAKASGKAAPVQSKAAQKYVRDSMRVWARGYLPTMPDRGRIASEIEAAYHNNRDVAALEAFARSKQMTFKPEGRRTDYRTVVPAQAAPEASVKDVPAAVFEAPAEVPAVDAATVEEAKVPAQKPAAKRAPKATKVASK